MVEIVATTSLPVDRLTATDCNAAARANISKQAGAQLGQAQYIPRLDITLIFCRFGYSRFG